MRLAQRLVTLVGRHPLVKVPAGAVFGLIPEQVQFMVADNGERVARLDQTPHQPNHPDTVRSPVTQVADKYQLTVLDVLARFVVTESAQQRQQGIVFTMDVANHVQWSFGQGLDERV